MKAFDSDTKDIFIFDSNVDCEEGLTNIGNEYVPAVT